MTPAIPMRMRCWIGGLRWRAARDTIRSDVSAFQPLARRCNRVLLALRSNCMQTLEGTIVEKEGGLRASFQGTERPYVRATIARLDAPEVMRQARIYDVEE